jgi:hypothetical protein
MFLSPHQKTSIGKLHLEGRHDDLFSRNSSSRKKQTLARVNGWKYIYQLMAPQKGQE